MTESDFARLRRESGIVRVRIFLFASIWAVTCLIGAPIILYTAPDIEAAVYPPLTHQKIVRPHLKTDDDGFLLWTWQFYKNRSATPEYVSFMAFASDNPRQRIPVEVFTDWDCKRNFQTDRASAVNDYATREMCIRLPDKWRGRKDIQVDGYAEYRVTHSLWTVPVKIPPTSDAWRQVGPNEKGPPG